MDFAERSQRGGLVGFQEKKRRFLRNETGGRVRLRNEAKGMGRRAEKTKPNGGALLVKTWCKITLRSQPATGLTASRL